MYKNEYMKTIIFLNEKERTFTSYQLSILLSMAVLSDDNLELTIDVSDLRKIVAINSLTTYYKQINPLLIDGFLLEVARFNKNQTVKYRLVLPPSLKYDKGDNDNNSDNTINDNTDTNTDTTNNKPLYNDTFKTHIDRNTYTIEQIDELQELGLLE